jgi:hypothetical protein
MLEIEEEKLIATALYVLDKLKPNERGMHKVLKILWFADLKHIEKYGRPITYDYYAKMPDGPVLSLLFDIFKAIRAKNGNLYDKYSQYICVYDYYMLTPLKKADADCLSDSDVEAMDESIEENRNFSKTDLSKKSHGIAWEHSCQDISLENILDELGIKGKKRDEILESRMFTGAFV